MATSPTGDLMTQLIEDGHRLAGEVMMLNLLEFKSRADSDDGGTGQESYGRYTAAAIQKRPDRDSDVVRMGTADQVFAGMDA